jgi:hypothetical protein
LVEILIKHLMEEEGGAKVGQRWGILKRCIF